MKLLLLLNAVIVTVLSVDPRVFSDKPEGQSFSDSEDEQFESHKQIEMEDETLNTTRILQPYIKEKKDKLEMELRSEGMLHFLHSLHKVNLSVSNWIKIWSTEDVASPQQLDLNRKAREWNLGTVIVYDILSTTSIMPKLIVKQDGSQNDMNIYQEAVSYNTVSETEGDYHSNESDLWPVIVNGNVTLNIRVKITKNALGLAIAGGRDSTPYKGDDEGIFISKVVQNGSAYNAGLKVGDKLLLINGKDVNAVSHYEVVDIMRQAKMQNEVQLKVIREITRDVPEEDHPPHLVQAIYNYDGDEETSSLSLQKGDIITVMWQRHGNLWFGKIGNRDGWFPKNYVKDYQP